MTAQYSNTAKLRQRRVVWKTDEIEAICDFIKASPDLGFIIRPMYEIIDAAQRAVLPKERWRNPRTACQTGKDVRNAIDAAVEARKAGPITITTPRPTTSAPPPPPPTPVPAPPLPVGAIEASGAINEPVAPLEPPTQALGDSSPPPLLALSTSSLLGELLLRFSEEFLARIDRGFDRLEAALVDRLRGDGPSSSRPAPPSPPSSFVATAKAAPPEKIKPPTCTIVGLMRDQFEHVKNRVSELGWNFVFADKEDRHPRFGHTDYIVFQKHAPHTWWSEAQKVVPSTHLVFADGGIDKTVQRIYDLHSKRVAAAGKL